MKVPSATTDASGVISCGFMTPVGPLLITARNDAVFSARFVDELCPDPPRGVLEDAVRWYSEYFEGKNPQWVFRTEVESTRFTSLVWSILKTIPFGQTTTYGRIRDMIEEMNPGKRVAAQAVGGAVGRNPLAIICPCHRVIGADGSLTGFAWGLDVKKALLEFERSVVLK